MFEARHSVCSKQDIPCVRSKTFRVFEAGHFLCSIEDIPCARSKTFLVLRTRDFVCSNHQQCTCHFLVNSTNRPRIWANRNQIRPNPGRIGRIRQKMACEFSNFERLKNREDSSDFDDFWTESIATTRTFFPEIFAPQKFSRLRKSFATNERTHIRTNERTTERPSRDVLRAIFFGQGIT